MQSHYDKSQFKEGMVDAIPIALGYITVSFALGIVAKNAGLTAFQGFIAALLNSSSSGEYAGFMLIKENAPYIEVAIMTLIANARYVLMSITMSQRFHESTSSLHKFIVGFFLTDEFFAIAIAKNRYINPYYSFGAISVASPCWAFGTALGVIMGNILPASLLSAFSVALYGMFLALVIPPAKKDKIILGVVTASFLFSYTFDVMPRVRDISDGMRTIILTIIISTIVSIIFPVELEGEDA